MNSNRPFEGDKPLSKVLSEWRVHAASPPHFQEQVWKRIESAEMRSPNLWPMIWKRVAAMLLRPAFAAAYMAALVLIGAAGGYQQGHSKTKHIKFDMQTRYIQMVDPYKTPR